MAKKISVLKITLKASTPVNLASSESIMKAADNYKAIVKAALDLGFTVSETTETFANEIPKE